MPWSLRYKTHMHDLKNNPPPFLHSVMHSCTYMSCYANLSVCLSLVSSFLEKHVAVRCSGISSPVPLTPLYILGTGSMNGTWGETLRIFLCTFWYRHNNSPCMHTSTHVVTHTCLHMQLQTNEMFVLYPSCPVCLRSDP